MAKIDKNLKELLENNTLAFATSYNDAPNVIAIGCVKVISENELIITDNYMNKTKSNLLKNKNIALVVWNKGCDAGYQLKGEADYMTKGKWFDFVKNMEENKGMPAKAAILVKIKEIFKLA